MISEFCDRMLLLLLVESGGKGGTHAMVFGFRTFAMGNKVIQKRIFIEVSAVD